MTSLTQLPIPNETMWLIAKFNHIPYLQWSESLSTIQHFELQNSSIHQIAYDFFSRIKSTKTATYLNLANNDLASFPKSLNSTHFSQVYLAGNPVECNCDMLWFAEFLNVTNHKGGTRIVKDYDDVVCEGGKWNRDQVYTLRAVTMGCYPKIVLAK